MQQDQTRFAQVVSHALHGRSRRWLASEVGLSATTIRAYELGKQDMPAYRAERLAAVLGLNQDWVLEMAAEARQQHLDTVGPISQAYPPRTGVPTEGMTLSELSELQALVAQQVQASAALAAWIAAAIERRESEVETEAHEP